MVKRNPSFLHTSPSVLLMTGNVSSLENHAQGLSHDDVWSVNGLSVVRQSLTNCLSTNKDIYNERGRCSYLTVTQDRTYYLIILQGFLSKHFNLEVAWRPTVCFFFFLIVHRILSLTQLQIGRQSLFQKNVRWSSGKISGYLWVAGA